MGGPKALLPFGVTNLLGHACVLMARPGVCSVVAVIGAEAARVRESTRLPQGVALIENEHWPDGMLTSIRRGLAAAEERGADAVLLHPVDHPLVDPATVDRVVAALADGAFVAVPAHAGRRGHPGGFSHETFEALRTASPDRGARGVLADHAERVVHVPGDPGCVIGLDTPQDVARWLGGRVEPSSF